MAEADVSSLEVRSRDGVRTWVMSVPPVNPIGPELLSALERELSAALEDESVAVVVIGSGLKVFSAGADAKWMAEVGAELGSAGLLEEFNRIMDRFRDLCARLRQSPLLTIAALDGHTLAGGLELAAACDLRFATDDERLRIGAPEMDLFGAMPSGGGGAQFLNRAMRPSAALQLILDAKPISPRAAHDLGLVDRLVEGSALEEAEAWADEVAGKAGRIGVAAAKRSILGGAEVPLGTALELDRSLHWDTMRRGNFLAGVDTFIERHG